MIASMPERAYRQGIAEMLTGGELPEPARRRDRLTDLMQRTGDALLGPTAQIDGDALWSCVNQQQHGLLRKRQGVLLLTLRAYLLVRDCGWTQADTNTGSAKLSPHDCSLRWQP